MAFLIRFLKSCISSKIIRTHLPRNQKIYLSIILNILLRICHMSYGNFFELLLLYKAKQKHKGITKVLTVAVSEL